MHAHSLTRSLVLRLHFTPDRFFFHQLPSSTPFAYPAVQNLRWDYYALVVEMEHLSDLANLLAVSICWLGFEHARLPWARYDHLGSMHHRPGHLWIRDLWCLAFAVCLGVTVVTTFVQIRLSAPILELLLLSWPWISGLVVEVYTYIIIRGIY